MSREPKGPRRTARAFAATGLCAILVTLSPGSAAWAQTAEIAAVRVPSVAVPAAGAAALGVCLPMISSPISLTSVPSALGAASLAAAPALPPTAVPSPAVSPSAAPAAAAAFPESAVGALAAPATADAAAGMPAGRGSAAAPTSAPRLLSGARALAAAPASRAQALDRIFDGAVVFLARPDRAVGASAAAVPVAGLGAALAADPALKSLLARSGRVRLVLSKSQTGGLTRADAQAVRAALRAAGVDAKLEIETVSLGGAATEDRPAPSADDGSGRVAPRSPLRRVLSLAAAPAREAAFLGRTLAAAFTKPTFGAVVAGVVMKFVIPMVVLRQTGWIASYAGHPVALALAFGFAAAINLFHGVWVGTWANFQNALAKRRGLNYQAVFNFTYGQMLGVVSRVIAWTAIAGTVPPWSLRYWKDVGIMAVVGTFFGTLGYQGINILYNNGRISQRARNGIFLTRDLVMNLAGFFFGSGSMMMFWAVFLAQQATDFSIYAASQRLKARPILYVADAAVAASPEFAAMYPVGPRPAVEESPLKQAWNNLLDSPFLKPVAWAAKAARRAFSKS